MLRYFIGKEEGSNERRELDNRGGGTFRRRTSRPIYHRLPRRDGEELTKSSPRCIGRVAHLREADDKGQFNSFDGYKNLITEYRHDFRIVKLVLSKATTVDAGAAAGNGGASGGEGVVTWKSRKLRDTLQTRGGVRTRASRTPEA